MKPMQLALLMLALMNGGISMATPHAADADAGVRKLPAHHSVKDTVDRLAKLLEERGIMIFARIDFSGDATKNGLSMPPEQQLIFGNPKAGTPLMLNNPASALDLPIRVICWADLDGKTWLAYNDPAYVVKRHNLPENLAGNIAAVIPLLEKAAAE